MKYNNYIYILVMAVVSFAIRTLPITLIRKPIKNKFVQSFLYYVPYVTLSIMIFPDIIENTSNPLYGLVALIIGVVLAWFNAGLFPTALSCCGVVLILDLIF